MPVIRRFSFDLRGRARANLLDAGFRDSDLRFLASLAIPPAKYWSHIFKTEETVFLVQDGKRNRTEMKAK